MVDGKFSRLKSEDLDSLTDQELKNYQDDLAEHLASQEKALNDQYHGPCNTNTKSIFFSHPLPSAHLCNSGI